MENSSNNSLPLLKQIDLVSRIFSLLGIIAYFSGLLITHIFLASHGFFIFELLKVDYIFVGGLWLALLALAFIWSGAVFEQFRGIERDKRGDAIMTSILLIFIYLFMMGLISVFSVDEVSGLSDTHLLYTCSVFMGQAISLHIIIWMYRGWIRSNTKDGQFSLLVIFAMVAVMIFLSVYYRYAIDIYPLYPRILGGGKSAEAQLVISQESWNSAKAIGLELDSTGQTPLVLILYETPDAYFIISKDINDRGIKISASEVSYVVYHATGNTR